MKSSELTVLTGKRAGNFIRKSRKFPEFFIDNQCIRDIILYKG